MTYLKDFRKKIETNDYPGFLKIWEEYCYSDEIDEDEFLLILEESKKSDLSPSFGRHVDRGVLLWRIMKDPQKRDKAIQLIFDIQNVNSEELAEIAFDFLTQKYPNDAHAEEKIRITGLKTKENFQRALSGYELLTHLKPGKFVYHTAGWGTGEVLDVSLIREEVTIEFEYVLGAKTFSFKNALKTLIPLQDNHFLSLRFGNPDELEKEAKKDPLKVIHMLLNDLGPKTSQEMKDELCEFVIPEEEWSKWWQSARTKMKKDTKMAFPSSSKEPFSLLREGVSHEDALYKALEAHPQLKESTLLTYNFIRDFSESLKNEGVKNTLKNKIEDLLKNAQNEGEKLQLYFLLEELGEHNDAITNIITHTPSFNELIEQIDIVALKKRALMEIRKLKSDWQELFFNLFYSLQQNVLREYLLSELENISPASLFEEKILELVAHPYYYPYLFVWYFQKIIEKESSLPYANKEGQIKFLEAFFILLSHIELKADYKDLAKKMVSILLAKRYKIIRKVFEQSSIEDLKEFILLASKCLSIADHDKKIIHSLAAVVYPSLKTFQNTPEEPIEEDIIWTTAEGYIKAQKKLKHLSEIEILENAKEIEEARSHGDLRENAPYKAALERRDRLQTELKSLSEQLNKAKVLSKDLVNINHVDVGTVIKCIDSDGKTQLFTLLGPWDANPERNVLSINSKVAQKMKGKKAGETFEFQGHPLTIKEISNYFET